LDLLVLTLSVSAAWTYLAVFHGRFWLMPRTQHQSTHATPRVAVIVPARNEEDVIGEALKSLVEQEYAGEFHLFVIDDNSTDGTGATIEEVRRRYPDRITLIRGKALPPGWSGKVWAMQQGWEAAQKLDPEYVWLTDADIHHSPDRLGSLVDTAYGHYDLVSLMVRLHCESFAEGMLIPAFVYFFFLLYPPEWVASRKRKTAGAAGGCVLVGADALRKIGAFECIRSEIIDDCSLAREVKRAGGRLWLGVTKHSRSIRPYDGFGGIRKMIARTAFNQLKHSTLLLITCVVGMAFTFLLPIALLFATSLQVQTFAVATCLLMLLTYLPAVRWHGRNPAFVLQLPLAALFFVYATFCSAVDYWRGKGGRWKGRAQDQIIG
jgi:hopene-associated glycosyltransferase HpnB